MDFSFINEMADADGYITDPAKIDAVLEYLVKNYEYEKSETVPYFMDMKELFQNKKKVFTRGKSYNITEAVLTKLAVAKYGYIAFYYADDEYPLISVHENSFYSSAFCLAMANTVPELKKRIKNFANKLKLVNEYELV